MSKPKKAKSVKKIVSDVLFGLFMAFFGIVFIFSILQKTVGISISGHHVLWVKTNSMEPVIPTSSYILCKDVKAEDVKPGDIITFVSDDPTIKGMLNTHKVKEKIEETGEFITYGINNPGQDAYRVKPENVKYIYEKNLPFMSFFGKLFTTPVGYALTVVGIIGLVGVWFTIDYFDRKKEKQLSKKELMDQMVKEEVARLEEEAKLKKIK
ncbi:MAG: signal peptidase I [Firmicutes bacterium]|nr:signal peptidase I [Candidatus Fiminaster equi]